MSYTIKKAISVSELHNIATCRVKAFPDSLSSALGISYVKNLLSFYLSGDNFLIYVEDQGKCIGFVTGMVPKSEFLCSTREAIDLTYSDILKAILRKPWLLFHPVIINNINLVWELIVKKTGLIKKEKIKKSHTNFLPEIMNSVGLIDIAVLPEWQNKGMGGFLLKIFEDHCYEIGKGRMHLSVKPENVQAIKLYQKNKWKILDTNEQQIIFYKNDF